MSSFYAIQNLEAQFFFGGPITYTITTGALCSGAFIADQWVLTAAHCLGDFHPFWLGIFVGYDLKNKSWFDTPFTNVRAKEIHAHPGYNESNLANDIGLIKLQESIITYAKQQDFKHFNIGPICLPQKRDFAPIENEYTMGAGWGGQYFTTRLQMGYLKFSLDYPDKLGYGELGGPVIQTQMLDNQKICAGDSGSIVWQYHLGRAVAIGVISSSAFDQNDIYKCQNTKMGNSIVVWLPMKMDWIKNVTGLN